MLCPNCGKELPENARVCENCAAPVSEENLLTEEKPQEVENIAAETPVAAKKETQSGCAKWLLFGVLGIGVAGVAVLALIMLLVGALVAPTAEVTEDFSVVATDLTEDVPAMEGASLSQDNPYNRCFQTYSDFVLPDSGTAYMTRRDLVNLSQEAIRIARQEILARHGAVSQDGYMQEYFQSRDWYTAGSGEIVLTELEKDNLFMIDTYLAQLNQTLDSLSNPYLAYLTDAYSYILEGSNSVYVAGVDFAMLNQEELELARNEIYARRGCIFESEALKQYFYCTAWYTPDPAFSKDAFNKYEKSNLILIDLYERRREGVTFSSKNPYRKLSAGDYVMGDSSYRVFDYMDFMDMSEEKAVLVRNEIYARYGYTFASEDLLEFFLQREWYYPTTPQGDLSSIKLNATEKENVALLKTYEKNLETVKKRKTKMSYTYEMEGIVVTMPEYWKNTCTIENGSFCEKTSIKECGGHLFTLEIIDSDPSADYWPNGEWVGTITDANGVTRYLMAYYPTDIQYIPTAIPLYEQMQTDIGKIINAITAQEGYTYEPR